MSFSFSGFGFQGESSIFRYEFEKNVFTSSILFSLIVDLVGEDLINKQEKFTPNIRKMSEKQDEFLHNILKDFNFVNPILSITELNQFINRTNLQLIITYFESYAFSSLKEIIEMYPSHFKNKSINVSISDLLLKNSKLLVQEKIDKEIREKIIKYIEYFDYLDKLKIDHGVTKNEINQADKYLQIRNLFAHTNGKIDAIFLNRIDDNRFKIGDIYLLDSDLLNKIEELFKSLIIKIDKALLDKYEKFPRFRNPSEN